VGACCCGGGLREGGGYARGGAIKADGDEEGRGSVGENEVEANEGMAAAEEEAREEKWLNHYSSMHNILIVGDGDFSFSLALAIAFGCGANLLATTLDTYGSSTSIDSASFCYL
jgi:25S rRNA (uracil2634-N3)-methyltransferase